MKSCDVSDIVSSVETLCNLFPSIVQMVGEKNVVHMVTDNASNYKVVGKLLHAKYPGIYWSPCSAHCINLTLEDVVKMDLVQECVVLGSRITTFVYNHKWPLTWLRQKDSWTGIITTGATRFGINFIALKSLYDHKEHLEVMVICPDYKKFLKTEKWRGVKDTVLNQRFWNNCLIIVKIMEPLMRLLRICDTDEKPSLDYVYEGLSRSIRGTKEIFNNQESKYKPFIDIINKRWDKMLRKRLHAAAYWLNPAFQYDPNNSLHNESEAYKGLLIIIQDLHPDTPGIMHELRKKQKQLLLMNGGGYLALMHHTYKTWPLGFLVKHHPLPVGSVIRVCLSGYIPRRETDWSMKD
ncbi:hypothetical protein ACS0TY_018546 [Phlomoides rotata]